MIKPDPGRNEIARRNRRKGELLGFNKCILKVRELRDFYKNRYEKSKLENDSDKSLCLGRVFASEDIVNILIELKNK